MKLGVPTLCRYDLLDELLKSAEQGTVRPSGYIIIDNGNAYPRERLNALLGERASVAELISPGTNIGVAASWNRILEMIEDDGVIISNDDIEFGEKTFEELSTALETHPFVEGDGWALFGQTIEMTELVGWYDENFWPAYFEDVDYEERIRREGITLFNPLSTPVKHHGWATTRALKDAEWLIQGRARNQAYFLRKWGGGSRAPRWNGNPQIFQYDEPFNGSPPDGWSLRGSKQKESLMVMRWDVLNHIAKRIGAERYLEIGVADGSCMRKIEVTEKWGVDPNPSVESVRSATVFVSSTSDAFFEGPAKNAGKFDLVFIDGDHIAEQVLREVSAVLTLLTPKGVIVLHDCNPHTEAMQEVPWRAGEWTGDVWKAVVRLRRVGHALRVVNSDYGIGVLVPDVPVLMPPPDETELTWANLVEHRTSLLGLIDPWDWEAWFDTIA